MDNLKLFIIAAITFCSSNSLLAQQTEATADLRTDPALAKAIALYDQQLGRNTILYTGKSYHNPHGNIIGHQFYGEDYWEQGSVNYGGQYYDSVYLKYDTYKDQLLVENFNSHGFLSPIILFKTKVLSFDLMNQHFVRIDGDTISNLKSGYYNQLYNGNDLQVLVKRGKEIVDANDAIGLERNSMREKFVVKDRYYIEKNGSYYRVKKKSSLLKVMVEHKKELKAYIKKNMFQFKIQPDDEYVMVAQYYESLH